MGPGGERRENAYCVEYMSGRGYGLQWGPAVNAGKMSPPESEPCGPDNLAVCERDGVRSPMATCWGGSMSMVLLQD